MTVRIIQGDALEELGTLDDESVNCICTSPPYWRQRDYSVEGQIGLEETPDCGRRGKFRLRADLTDEQREYVVRRLLALERPDV